MKNYSRNQNLIPGEVFQNYFYLRIFQRLVFVRPGRTMERAILISAAVIAFLQSMRASFSVLSSPVGFLPI